MRARFLVVAVVAAAVMLTVASFQDVAFARPAGYTAPVEAHSGHALQSITPFSSPGQPSGPPRITYDPCLWVIQWSAWAIDSNNAGGKGQIENGCGWTVTGGSFSVYASVSCPGTASQTEIDEGNLTSPLYNYETAYLQGQNWGKCETCVNGQPVDFPPFSLTLSLSAEGGGKQGVVAEDNGGGGPIKVNLTNSPAYSFPCP